MNYPYGSKKLHDVLEVLDERDTVLALVNADAVQRQCLRHRVAALAVYDTRKRLLLQKTSVDTALSVSTPSACLGWTLPMLPVPAGHSLEDTALALLTQTLQLQGHSLSAPHDITAPALERESGMRVTLYQAHTTALPLPQQPHVEYMYIDNDELCGLAKHFSDMLAPWLHECLTQGLLRR